MQEINENELRKVDGGRLVIKVDTDGDGRWDDKYVWTNTGKYIERHR